MCSLFNWIFSVIGVSGFGSVLVRLVELKIGNCLLIWLLNFFFNFFGVVLFKGFLWEGIDCGGVFIGSVS